MKVGLYAGVLLSALLGALLLGGCEGFPGGGDRMLEAKNVPNLKMNVVQGNIGLMSVSGTVGDSALTVKNVKVVVRGGKENILMFLHLARSGESGSFVYTFSIPPGVNEVYFGKSGTRIWSRRTGPVIAPDRSVKPLR